MTFEQLEQVAAIICKESHGATAPYCPPMADCLCRNAARQIYELLTGGPMGKPWQMEDRP